MDVSQLLQDEQYLSILKIHKNACVNQQLVQHRGRYLLIEYVWNKVEMSRFHVRTRL